MKLTSVGNGHSLAIFGATSFDGAVLRLVGSKLLNTYLSFFFL